MLATIGPLPAFICLHHSTTSLELTSDSSTGRTRFEMFSPLALYMQSSAPWQTSLVSANTQLMKLPNSAPRIAAPALIGGGDAFAAGARPARHELVALVAVGEDDGAGLGHHAAAVDHAEADGAADAVAVLEQVDDLDAVLDAHAQLARVLGHVEREVLVEHGQAPGVLRQPAHVLGLAGVVAVDVHAPALEPLEVGPRLAHEVHEQVLVLEEVAHVVDVEVEDVAELRRVDEHDVAAALVGLAAPAGDDLVDDEHVDLRIGLLGADGTGEPGHAAADDQQVGVQHGAEALESGHHTTSGQ